MKTSRTPVPALLLALASLAACAGDGPRKTGQLLVPLEFRPTGSHAGPALSITAGQTIFVPPVVDDRTDRETVGQNNEGSPPVKIIASGTTPPDFVRTTFVNELRDSGLRVVDSASGATRVVSLRLVKFTCIETGTYATDVRASVTISSGDGAKLWEGLARGESSRFGRSLSTENYQECFSDATVKLSSGLLANADVQKTLSK